MVLEALFKSAARTAPKASSINHECAPAYELDSRTALAQLAATGCFGSTFYVSGQEQLGKVLEHAQKCDAAFVAKVAIDARGRGFMKDMPAVLLAQLATRGPDGIAAMKAAFPRAIDNGRMLRNFVQVIRSGRLGRKSLGTAPKNAVRRWLASRSAMQLFRDSIGNDPSLVDVIKMVHPRPASDEQRAMYGYLLGKAHDVGKLPAPVRLFEAWKRGEAEVAVPKVPSRMLAGLPLGKSEWKTIAQNARWHETRMNLNTYQRHGVFDDKAMVEVIASRLADKDEVRKAKVFPYQLLVAWKMASGVPGPIQEALQDAMEHAVGNIPEIDGRVVICPDVSGSMRGSVTGYRKGATSAVQCVDVAGLIAAAFLRKNPLARVIPFEHDVRPLRVNPRDSVVTIAERLASIGGGGTNCSAPLSQLNKERAKVDAIIYVSDNESWVDARGGSACQRGTAMMDEWLELRRRNPQAKLVCIDLTPNTHTQAIDRPDILNVGGFSDAVFDVVAQFVKADSPAHWAELIDRVEL
ncbi:MAG: TROVE domain-containing protein [Myxococcales bacterium]|nr:TROVE domain-containing protein [Myxococcales bacterium]